ncbi:hypothetical protein E3E35_07025 [Thermococcus sp. GR7]|uniref:hypothetical protein n=1 Tax=unclassified Thermococcus TaxID=2627626 RepID=UPI0014309AE0|nr:MULTISPECIES: hypothetical protein [unclassified Thermococcus]NJE47158.1 hypothetical protein [Thermococcus sp. GR7]NJE78017.1 hypothetical protein [Thermococcus sp. GR4]NJF22866.1 hypothetical protein [Thermococcus sp. GR5]
MIQKAKLFTSNDLVKPDILGIKLTVVVGWDANQTYLTQLVKGFQRASQVIYDYTDGYAMITEISIKNNVQVGSEEWENSMVRIEESGGFYTIHGFRYWLWFKENSTVPKGYVHLQKEWYGTPENLGYYRGVAHELAHFVFGIDDEYGAPFSWDYDMDGDTDGFTYDKLKYVLETEYGIYGFEGIRTIMDDSKIATELSTKGNPNQKNDYDWFYNELLEYDKKLREKFGYGLIKVITDHNGPNDLNKLEEMMPTHWHRTYIIDQIPRNMTSAWEVVSALLVIDHTLSYNEVYDQDAKLYLDLDFDGIPDSTLPVDYIPKVGPYTGVGYYLRVHWGDER